MDLSTVLGDASSRLNSTAAPYVDGREDSSVLLKGSQSNYMLILIWDNTYTNILTDNPIIIEES